VKYVFFLTLFPLIQQKPIFEVNLQCVKLLLLPVKIKYFRISSNNAPRMFPIQRNTGKSFMVFEILDSG
jgi:hypothetical protein